MGCLPADAPFLHKNTFHLKQYLLQNTCQINNPTPIHPPFYPSIHTSVAENLSVFASDPETETDTAGVTPVGFSHILPSLSGKSLHLCDQTGFSDAPSPQTDHSITHLHTSLKTSWGRPGTIRLSLMPFSAFCLGSFQHPLCAMFPSWFFLILEQSHSDIICSWNQLFYTFWCLCISIKELRREFNLCSLTDKHDAF